MLPLHFWLKQSLKTSVTGISLACLVLISNASTAAVTIEPITWNVIGLDSNKPAIPQPAPGVYPPDRYPVGVEVCNGSGSAISGYEVDFVWDETPSTNFAHLWDSSVDWNDGDVNTGDIEATSSQTVPDLEPSDCIDMYFWVQVEQLNLAYDFTRDFHIELTDGTSVVAETPNNNNPVGGTTIESRELYVEYLVSQNRNAVLSYQINGEAPIAADGTGSVTVAKGQVFDLTLYGQTATQGYEQIEAFIILPPDLFEVTEVVATYSSASGTDPTASSKLYADGCGWINNPDTDGYHESSSTCTSVGKYGGRVTKKYKVRVRESLYDLGVTSTVGQSFTAQALIYDFSGSSYHYNADHSSSSFTIEIGNPGDPGVPNIPVIDASITKAGTYNGGSDSGEWTISVTRETDLCNGTANCSEFGPITVIDELPAGYELKGTNNSVAESPDLSSALTYFDAQGSEIPFGSAARSFEWGPITLPVGTDSVDLDVQFRSSGAEILSAADVTNCARIEADKDATNNEACVVTVDEQATLPFDVAVTKGVSAVNVAPDDTVTVTFQIDVVTVSGSNDAIQVKDTLPAGYTFVNAGTGSGGLTFDSHSNGVVLMNFAAGRSSGSLTFNVTAALPSATDSAEDIESNYINRAILTDTSGNPLNDVDPGNNSASAAYVPPLLAIEKSPALSTLNGSNPDAIDYDIVVRKLSGFVAGNTIKLTEAPPQGLRFTGLAEAGAALSSWSCTVEGSSVTFPTSEAVECSRSVGANEPATITYPTLTFTAELNPVPSFARTLVNSVFVEGYDGGDPIPNTFDDDDAIIEYDVQEADLELEKSASTLTPAVGSTVTFTLTLTNDGPDTATNVEVTDSLPSGYEYVATSIAGGDGRNDSDASSLKWTVDSLAKDESVLLSYQANILPSGIYTNTAQVTASDQPDPDSSPNNDNGDQSEDDEATVTLTPSPVIDLELEKTPSALLVVVGDTVTYTLEVTNNGPSDATGIAIEDIIPAELTYATGTASDGGSFSSGKLTWSNLSVAAGNTKTLTYDVEVNSAGSAITNTAQVTAANEPDIDSTPNNGGGTPAEDDEASATIEATATFVPNPSLSLTKTGTLNDDDGTAGVSAGDTITYAFTVTNTGNTPVTDITLADTGATISGGPIASLAPGESDSTTFTATYTVTQADIDTGTYTNTATVTGDGTGTDDVTAQDDDTQPLARSASIALTKTGTLNDDDGTAGVSAGDTITYAFTVTNTGNTTITDIELADTGATISGGPIASLAPGESDSTTFTATYTVTQADIDAGTYTNTATVTGDGTGTDDVTAQDDDTQPLARSASIALTKTGTLNDDDGTAGVSAGDTITYAFTVTNTGNTTITDIELADTGATITGGPIASLAPGESDSTAFTATYTVTQADIDAGTYTNTATVTGDGTGTDDVTAQDDDTQPLARSASIALTKTGTLNDDDGTAGVSAGDTITYAFTVTNTGNTPVTDITLADTGATISGGPIASLAPGESDSTTFTATYTVTQADIDTGTYTNTATVTGDGTGTDDVTAQDDDTQPLARSASIALTKTGTLNDDDGTAGVSAGDTITYAFTVTNTGNTTITDIELADTGATISGGPIASLAPGESDSTTFTATYTVTQADIDAGTYTNTATVTGDGTGTDDVTAQDDDTQPLARSASIALTKTGTLNDDDGTAGVSAGDTITYAFTVTNTGNTTITDIELADTGATITGGPIASLAPGESDSTAFTATYTVTQADIDAGTYTNTATVTGDGTGTDDVTAQDDDTQTLDGTVSLSGLVFQELTSEYNGLLTEGDQPTNGGGGLYVCLNTIPARYQAVGTGAVGAFAFTGLEANTTYSLILTTESSGASCPDSSTLNENWFSTGESVDGVTTDTAVVVSESLSDGKLTVDVGSSDVTTITMGLVQADVFDPPFGLKTGEILAGSPVIRWTMVWINDSPIPVMGAEITDPPPAGTTYVDGSISCEPRGTTAVSVCEFDTVANTVHVVADFGPETGSPTDELTADNELLIVFDVTYDEANPEPEYVNQGTLTWDPGSGPTTSSTDDPTELGDDDPTVVVPPAAPPPPPPAAPPTPVPVSPWQLLFVLSLLTAWLGRVGLIRRRSWQAST